MILKPEMNCVDCGCHIGSVMTVFHKLCPRGKHVGVEALPHKAKWLRERFPSATIHQVAVGDEDGEVTFHFDVDASARSSMHKNASIQNEQKLTVKLKRLDDLLGVSTNGAGHRVHFLKVDVEGAELFAFRGARGIIARDKPPVFYECAPPTLKPFNITTFDVFAFFESINYKVVLPDEWIVSQDKTVPLTAELFDKAQHYPPIARNFLALPK
jgi:FkbM family methyltransferase